MKQTPSTNDMNHLETFIHHSVDVALLPSFKFQGHINYFSRKKELQSLGCNDKPRKGTACLYVSWSPKNSVHIKTGCAKNDIFLRIANYSHPNLFNSRTRLIILVSTYYT